MYKSVNDSKTFRLTLRTLHYKMAATFNLPCPLELLRHSDCWLRRWRQRLVAKTPTQCYRLAPNRQCQDCLQWPHLPTRETIKREQCWKLHQGTAKLFLVRVKIRQLSTSQEIAKSLPSIKNVQNDFESITIRVARFSTSCRPDWLSFDWYALTSPIIWPL